MLITNTENGTVLSIDTNSLLQVVKPVSRDVQVAVGRGRMRDAGCKVRDVFCI